MVVYDEDIFLGKNDSGFEFYLDRSLTDYANKDYCGKYKVVKIFKDGNPEGRLLYVNNEPYCELGINVEAAASKIDVIKFVNL